MAVFITRVLCADSDVKVRLESKLSSVALDRFVLLFSHDFHMVFSFSPFLFVEHTSGWENIGTGGELGFPVWSKSINVDDHLLAETAHAEDSLFPKDFKGLFLCLAPHLNLHKLLVEVKEGGLVREESGAVSILVEDNAMLSIILLVNFHELAHRKLGHTLSFHIFVVCLRKKFLN